MDILKSAHLRISLNVFRISKNKLEFRISIIRFLDIHDSFFGIRMRYLKLNETEANVNSTTPDASIL